jgi:hypothetical protein
VLVARRWRVIRVRIATNSLTLSSACICLASSLLIVFVNLR